MIPDPAPPTREPLDAQDELLAGVLESYLAELEQGRATDAETLIGQHPTIGDRLRACLNSLQTVEQGFSGLFPAGPTPGGLPQLRDFRILREIGRGGMGVVYEADQFSLNRRVALKILPLAAALDARQLQRFRHETQAAAHLHHTNIVPIFSVGCERGIHYYSMQYIEGQNLAAYIAALAPLEGEASPGATRADTAAAALATERPGNGPELFRTAANLGVQAAEALECAHQQGVIHRDVKPANLLIDGRGTLWVTDFGLARFQDDVGLTRSGDLVGTLRYMAPEQVLARKGVVDHRADVYALGMTLYELLTLRPAFDGRDRRELLRQIAFEEPPAPRRLNPAIPADLETVVLKATAKALEERYASAQELADDLRRFLEHRPIRARRPSLLDRTARWARRNRPLVASAVGLLLAAVVGLACSTVLIAREQQRTRAAYEAEATQRTRAEQNFRQARRAVDFISQLCEEELGARPETQGVRRKLLEAAVAYYQDFIDQHADNPDLQAELAGSQLRVAGLLEQVGSRSDAQQALARAHAWQDKLARDDPSAPEFLRGLFSIHLRGGPHGDNSFHLLTQKSVQEELKLPAEQVQPINRLMDRQRAFSWEARGFPREEWHERFEELARQKKAVLDALRPEQARRLAQIALQQRGPNAFTDPDVAEALHLSDEQRAQVHAIRDEARAALHGPPRGPGPERGRRPDPSSADRLLQLLTAGQRARWEELQGTPFKGEIRWGRPHHKW